IEENLYTLPKWQILAPAVITPHRRPHPPITHLQHHFLNTHYHNSLHTSITTNLNFNHRHHLRLPYRKGIPSEDSIKIYLYSLNRNLKRLARTINPIQSLNLKVFNLYITFRTTYSMVNLLNTIKVAQMGQYMLRRQCSRKKKEKEERKEQLQNKDKAYKCEKMLGFWTRRMMLDCIGRMQASPFV
ncbi:hypothetical protein GIB67_031552, partial [Kingdonia uniflora]